MNGMCGKSRELHDPTDDYNHLDFALSQEFFLRRWNVIKVGTLFRVYRMGIFSKARFADSVILGEVAATASPSTSEMEEWQSARDLQ